MDIQIGCHYRNHNHSLADASLAAAHSPLLAELYAEPVYRETWLVGLGLPTKSRNSKWTRQSVPQDCYELYLMLVVSLRLPLMSFKALACLCAVKSS